MVLLNNINQFIFSQSQTGKNIIEIHFFKDKPINLVLIKNFYFDILLKNKNLNSLDIYYISLNNSYIELITRENNSLYSRLNSLCIQKSNVYNNFKEGYQAFNIVSYKLGNIWKSENFFNKGDNYKNISVFSDFIGNVTTLSTSKIIKPLLEFTSTIPNSSIDLNNLLYFTNIDYLFGYKNQIVNKICYIPLLRPVPNLKITFKNKNTTKSSILEFINIDSFFVDSINYSSILNEKKVASKTLRITSGTISEIDKSSIKNETIDKFEIIQCKIENGSLFQNPTLKYYVTDYNTSEMYDLKINIFTIKFLNNYSTILQDYNKLVINKETNKNLSTLLTTNSTSWFDWGTDYITQTDDSYLNLKVIGITEQRLNLLGYNDLTFKLLIQNNNTNVMNLYLQNKSYREGTDVSGNYSGFKSINDDYGVIKLKNNKFELIPIPFTTSDGLQSLVSFTVVENNNDLFDNLIIDNVIIKVAGLQSNVSKVIINLNLKSNLGYSTYSTPIQISSIGDRFYSELRIEDEPLVNGAVDVNDYHKEFRNLVDEFQGKNPIIRDNPLILTLRYEVNIINNNIIFTRESTDDKTINSDFINSQSLTTDICNNFLATFNPREDEILYFNMKNTNNLGKTIKFYQDASCINELINENTFITDAIYSRNYVPGEEGSFIQLTVPKVGSNGDTRITDNTIYYKIVELNDINTSDNSLLIGKIIIQNRKRLHHSEITVAPINNIINNSGLLTYSNSVIDFYDPGNVKPRYGLGLYNHTNNQNYYLIEKNNFNNYDISYSEHLNNTNSTTVFGDIIFDASNSNVFIGDNLYFLKRYNNISNNNSQQSPFFNINRRFYFKNENLTDGRIRIGLVNNNNRKLFTSTNPTNTNFGYDISNNFQNIETYKTYTNNTTDYIVYKITSSNFPIPATKVERIGTSNNYNIEQTDLSSCVLNITEDSLGRILYNSTSGDLRIAFVRKKFSFDIKIQIVGGALLTTPNDIFFMEPLNYDSYKNNYDLNNNYYLVAFFYTEDNDKYVGFLTLLLNHNKPYYVINSNSFRKVRFFNDSNSTLNPYILNSGNNFTLRDASGQMLIDKYNSFNDINRSTNVVDRVDAVSSSSWTISSFTLPLLDLFELSDFTIEVYYYSSNQQDLISYKLVKANSSLTDNFEVIDSGSINRVSDPNNYNSFLNETFAIDIDENGEIIFVTPGTKPDLFSNNNNQQNKLSNNYLICIQVQNYSNNDYIERLANLNIFNNFDNGETVGLFGLAGTNSNINESCLNVKKFTFPLFNPEKIVNFLVDKINQINTKHPGIINPTHVISNETITLIDNSLNLIERYKFSNQDISKNNIIRDISNAINGGTMSLYDISSQLLDASFNSFIENNKINQIKNKQPAIRLSGLSIQDIEINQDDLSKTGTGAIRYFTKEYDTLNQNREKGSYNKIHGNDIIFNAVDVDNIRNLRKTIFNESHVLLEWEHENDNLTVTIAFRIYRSQGENLSNFYLLGETTKKTFTDTTAIPYLTTRYKIETVIKWEREELILDNAGNIIDAFLCENNQFPYGRYNTNPNPKLFFPLGNSATCSVNQKKTTNLFPNSLILTKKQVYAELSRAKNRPFR